MQSAVLIIRKCCLLLCDELIHLHEKFSLPTLYTYCQQWWTAHIKYASEEYRRASQCGPILLNWRCAAVHQKMFFFNPKKSSFPLISRLLASSPSYSLSFLSCYVQAMVLMLTIIKYVQEMCHSSNELKCSIRCNCILFPLSKRSLLACPSYYDSTAVMQIPHTMQNYSN